MVGVTRVPVGVAMGLSSQQEAVNLLGRIRPSDNAATGINTKWTCICAHLAH